MEIRSVAFKQMQGIPNEYSCQGKNVSPPLTFHDLPEKTQSIALIVEDPDAPGGTFIHWVAWNWPSSIHAIEAGVAFPDEGINSKGKIGYTGPCPPPGKPHRYFFKAFALDKLLLLPNNSTNKDLVKAMEGHILDQSELVGTYQRS